MKPEFVFLFLALVQLGCSQPGDKKKATADNNSVSENNSFIASNPIAKMTNTEKEVLETVKKWNDCFTRNDTQKYFEFIHDDLTLFIPSSPYKIVSRQDDKEEFEWSLNKSRTKVHFFQELQPQVQVYDSTAIVTYYTRGAYGPDGNEQMAYLKETDVLVRENGKWKVVHIHVSK
jgi:ketosteroid isomerase-like protein